MLDNLLRYGTEMLAISDSNVNLSECQINYQIVKPSRTRVDV